MYVPEGTHEQVEIMEYNTRAVQNRQLPGETEITVSTSQFIDRLSNVAAPQGMHIIYIYIYIIFVVHTRKGKRITKYQNIAQLLSAPQGKNADFLCCTPKYRYKRIPAPST